MPGRGRSRNVIGALDSPRSLPAHRDGPHRHHARRRRAPTTTPRGWACWRRCAGRLARQPPRCDVWLVATGAEERVYTGSPDHLGALALARRVRARGRTPAALGAVARRGGARPALLAALARRARPAARWRARCCARPGGPGCPSAGCATRPPATPTTASSSCWACPRRSWAWAPAASPAATARATAPAPRPESLRAGAPARGVRAARAPGGYALVAHPFTLALGQRGRPPDAAARS